MSSVFPYKFQYTAGTNSAFAQALSYSFTTSDDNVQHVSVLPPCIISGTRYDKGILLVSYVRLGVTAAWEMFDVSSGNRLSAYGSVSLPITQAMGNSDTSGAYLSNIKGYPLGRLAGGSVLTFKRKITGTNYCALAVLTPSLNTYGSNPIHITVNNGQELQDVTPIPRASRPAFHVAESVAATGAGEVHLRAYQMTGTTAASLAEVHNKKFTSGSWTGTGAWSTNPEGCLAVENLPWDLARGPQMAGTTPRLALGRTVVLLGTGFTWDTTHHFWYCYRPRVAIVNANISSGSGDFGTVMDATAEGASNDYANCMCVNQYGDIYVAGYLSNQSTVINRYTLYNLGAVASSVTAAIAPSSLAPPIAGMAWDGNRLIVTGAYQAGLTTDNIFYFDRDLTYLGRQTAIASNGQAGGNNLPPIVFNKFSHAWKGWNW